MGRFLKNSMLSIHLFRDFQGNYSLLLLFLYYIDIAASFPGFSFPALLLFCAPEVYLGFLSFTSTPLGKVYRWLPR